jgi:hypothetical protein
MGNRVPRFITAAIGVVILLRSVLSSRCAPAPSLPTFDELRVTPPATGCQHTIAHVGCPSCNQSPASPPAVEITVRQSPDFLEITERFTLACRDIAAADMWSEPQVLQLLARHGERMNQGNFLNVESCGTGEYVSYVDDDDFLEILAQWQALRRVAIARLQARGWRL